MSLAIYPVFEPTNPAIESTRLGEVLAREFQTLDKIAQANGLTPLTAFGDDRQIPEDFEGDPDELRELMGPFEEWFSPAESKGAFQALADLIQNRPSAARKLEEPEAVVAELEELVRVLTIAQKYGARFHLEMG
jgi:hypothetical protein